MILFRTLCIVLLFSPLAIAQNYTSYSTGSTTDVITNPTGGSVLMGGATESDEAMQWFLERADGGDVLVLRASGSDGYNDYLYSELGVTVNSVETIVFNNATAATEAYIHDRISKAEAIWFAGGDQWNYVSYWRDTPIQTLINEAINDRGAVIGGTSAGMAIMGGHYFTAQNGTVSSAAVLNNPYHPRATIGSEPFLEIDYLSAVITDTHYDDPDRRGRQTTFLARIMQDTGVAARGIACDEYTAVCIDQAGIARVFGDFPSSNDNAYFIMSNCDLTDPTPEVCQLNTPLRWNRGGMALKVYTIKGTTTGNNTFDLNDWSTGVGGVWEDWSVNDAAFLAQSGAAISCNPLNVQELDSTSIQVYPNPTQDWVNIKSLSGINSVKLFDINGRVQVIQSEFLGDTFRIATQTLSSGVYMLVIRSETGQTSIKRIVKTN